MHEVTVVTDKVSAEEKRRVEREWAEEGRVVVAAARQETEKIASAEREAVVRDKLLLARRAVRSAVNQEERSAGCVVVLEALAEA